MNENREKCFAVSTDVLNNIICRISHSLELLEQSKYDKSLLLKENIFLYKEDLAFFLENFLKLNGENNFNIFMQEYASSIIEVIKERIPYTEVLFRLDYSQQYVFIDLYTITDNIEFTLFKIDPFLKVIYLEDNPHIKEIEYNIDNKNEELNSIYNKVSDLDLAKENPLYYAGENNIKFVDMLIRRKKYSKVLDCEKQELLIQSCQIQSELNNLKIDLDNYKLGLNNCLIFRDKYISRFQNYFNFEVIDFTSSIESTEVTDDLDISNLNLNI